MWWAIWCCAKHMKKWIKCEWNSRRQFDSFGTHIYVYYTHMYSGLLTKYSEKERSARRRGLRPVWSRFRNDRRNDHQSMNTTDPARLSFEIIANAIFALRDTNILSFCEHGLLIDRNKSELTWREIALNSHKPQKIQMIYPTHYTFW